MNTYADRLGFAMKVRKVRAVELARRTGLDKSLISIYVNGKHEPRFENNELIAKALNINPDWLLGTSELMDTSNVLGVDLSFRKIPIYAPLSCGLGSFEDGTVIDYIGIPETKLRFGKRYFGQYAKGDSMMNAGINDGDLLIFEACEWLDEGKIGCFCIDEELAVCKRFTIGADKCVYLMSANDKYPPIRIDQTNTCFRIVGRLSSVVKNIE